VPAALKIVGRVVAKSVERTLKHLMAPFNAKFLKAIIQKDKTVLQLLREQYQDYKRYPEKWRPEDARMLRYTLGALEMCRQFVLRFPKDAIDPYCTVPYAIDWLQRNRPDLCKVLLNERGLLWLAKQVVEVRKWLGLP